MILPIIIANWVCLFKNDRIIEITFLHTCYSRECRAIPLILRSLCLLMTVIGIFSGESAHGIVRMLYEIIKVFSV